MIVYPDVGQERCAEQADLRHGGEAEGRRHRAESLGPEGHEERLHERIHERVHGLHPPGGPAAQPRAGQHAR